MNPSKSTLLTLLYKQKFLPAATARWSISALCQNEGGGGATNFGGMGNHKRTYMTQNDLHDTK